MGVLQRQVESLTRQFEKLGPENERVRKLLTEFDQRHAADQAEIERLRSLVDYHEEIARQASVHRDATFSGVFHEIFDQPIAAQKEGSQGD